MNNNTENIEDSLSDYNSYSDHNSSSDEDIDKINNRFSTYYDNNHTTKLEILLTYVKGQKHLFSYCSQLCKHKLNFLMVPTIIISTTNTMSSPFLSNYSWGNNFSSALNSVILLFISMISYFKYESNAESFMHISNQYDKIETALKLIGNNIHSNIENNEYNDKIKHFETKICEIKDGQKLLIPKEAINCFPIICQVNIFTLLRKMDHHKHMLLYKFKNVREQLRTVFLNSSPTNHMSRSVSTHSEPIPDMIPDMILSRIPSQNTVNGAEKGNETGYITTLYLEKERLKNEIQKTNEICSNIDDIFSREIRNSDRSSLFCGSFMQKKKMSFKGIHPLVEQYFTYVFAED